MPEYIVGLEVLHSVHIMEFRKFMYGIWSIKYLCVHLGSLLFQSCVIFPCIACCLILIRLMNEKYTAR